MDKDLLEEIKSRYKKLETSELIKITTKENDNYTHEALQAALTELKSRGIVDVEPSEGTMIIDSEKKSKPAVRILTRILCYFAWPVVWIFLLGGYGMVRTDLRSGVLNVLNEKFGVTDIVTLARTWGWISSFILFSLSIVFVWGFVVITKKTK